MPVMSGYPGRSALSVPILDTTFEPHYSIGELARQWKLGRETVRLLVKNEPGVLKIRMGLRKAMTRYSIPESVARRVHTRLFNFGSPGRSRRGISRARGSACDRG
jgi:hypothetical protein